MPNSEFPVLELDKEEEKDKAIANMFGQTSQLEKEKKDIAGEYGKVAKDVETGQVAESIIRDLLKAYTAYRGLKDKQNMSGLEISGLNWDQILKGRTQAVQAKEKDVADTLADRRLSLKERIQQGISSKRDATRRGDLEKTQNFSASIQKYLQEQRAQQAGALQYQKDAADLKLQNLKTETERPVKYTAARMELDKKITNADKEAQVAAKMLDSFRKEEETGRQYYANLLGVSAEDLDEEVVGEAYKKLLTVKKNEKAINSKLRNFVSEFSKTGREPTEQEKQEVTALSNLNPEQVDPNLKFGYAKIIPQTDEEKKAMFDRLKEKQPEVAKKLEEKLKEEFDPLLGSFEMDDIKWDKVNPADFPELYSYTTQYQPGLESKSYPFGKPVIGVK